MNDTKILFKKLNCQIKNNLEKYGFIYYFR